MKKFFLLLPLLYGTYISFSQVGTDLFMYDFREIPQVSAEDDSLYAKEGLLGLGHRIIWDYRINYQGTLELWTCQHTMVKIYDKEELRRYNKLTFHEKDIETLITCKGRLIGSNGEITVLNQEDLRKETEEISPGEEVISSHTYSLVFEEAKEGDIIEFFYIMNQRTIPELARIILQDQYHNRNMEFTLILPDFLKADIRSYNGLPDAVDTILPDRRIRYAHIFSPEIPALPQEPVSNYLPHLQSVEFVIAYNYARSQSRYNTFNTYASNLYDILSAIGKEEQNALKKIGSKIRINRKMDDEQKIRNIEKYIKEHFVVFNFSHPSLYDISNIAEFGFGNTVGLSKIYYHLFSLYGLEFEIVMTCDKTKNRFDPTFDAINNLQEILFYFPSVNSYLSPDLNPYRLGIIPSHLAGQYAVFYEPVSSGGLPGLLPETKLIPTLPMRVSCDSLNVEIRIEPEKEIVEGKISRSLSGYKSIGIQHNFPYFSDEEKEFFIEHYMSFGSSDNMIYQEKFLHTGSEDVGVKPFQMEGDFVSSVMTSTRKDGFILEIGKLIGEQAEIVQEKMRILPVELDYRNYYIRTIKVEIPEGYECTDMDSLKVCLYDTDKKEDAGAGFEVKAEQTGNWITITCYEYYDTLYYPAKDFEKYQRVVNEAFAFNQKKLTFRMK